MKVGPRARLALDAILAASLFVASAYPLTGGVLHEWTGTIVLAVVLIHNLINAKWYGAFVGGRFNRRRVPPVIVNLALLMTAAAALISGMMMSVVVFPVLNTSADLPLREIHNLAAHWFLVLASVHLGLHWTMVATIIGQAITPVLGEGRIRTLCTHIFWGAVVVYGATAFVVTRLGWALTGYDSFGFWDFDEAPAWFFVRRTAIMGLIVFIVHHTPKIFAARVFSTKKTRNRRTRSEDVGPA